MVTVTGHFCNGPTSAFIFAYRNDTQSVMCMAADAEEFFLQCDPTSENLVAYVSIPYAFSDSACQLLTHERLSYLTRRWLLVCSSTSCSRLVQGNADSTWSVALPAEEVPPELPEPCLGSLRHFGVTPCSKLEHLCLVRVY